MTNIFDSTETVKSELSKQKYIASDEMTPAEAQMLAEALRQFAAQLRQRMERLWTQQLQ